MIPFTTTDGFRRDEIGLDQFLGLEETLEMSHLPGAHDQEDAGLGQGPPQHSLVGALASLTEPLLSVSLIILLLGDLLNL